MASSRLQVRWTPWLPSPPAHLLTCLPASLQLTCSLSGLPIPSQWHAPREVAGIKLGEFPSVAALACCRSAHRCYNQVCFAMDALSDAQPRELRKDEAPPARLHEAPVSHSLLSTGDAGATPSSVDGGGIDAVSAATTSERSCGLTSNRSDCKTAGGVIQGKYRSEVHSLVVHMRWLRCPGARYAAWPASLLRRWGGRAALLIIVPVGRRAVPREQLNRFILPEHAFGSRMSKREAICPIRRQPKLPAHELALTGLCAPTEGAGDCTDGHSGSWAEASLASCEARCRACRRCNFISFSRLHRDCSWYHIWWVASCTANPAPSHPSVHPSVRRGAPGASEGARARFPSPQSQRPRARGARATPRMRLVPGVPAWLARTAAWPRGAWINPHPTSSFARGRLAADTIGLGLPDTSNQRRST